MFKCFFASVLLCLACAFVSCQGIRSDVSGYAFKGSMKVLNANERVSNGFWDKPAYLEGEHVIVINRRQQNAKYFIGGVQVGITTISSGSEGRDTPAGVYKVLEKDEDHRSSKYGSWVGPNDEMIQLDYTMGQPKPTPDGKYLGAPMFHGMKLNNTGIWMHEGVVTSAPESHGCIRLPAKMAKIFYDNTPLGSKVIVE